jgi:hypothetical protein
MKRQISFAAMVLVVATTALGFAIVRHRPLINTREAAPVRPDDSTGEGVPRRIDCFIGMRGEPGSLYRGWICDEREPAPKLKP